MYKIKLGNEHCELRGDEQENYNHVTKKVYKHENV